MRFPSQLLEVFGTGTAAVISPVEAIKYRGMEIEVRLGLHSTSSQSNRGCDHAPLIESGSDAAMY